MWPSPSDKVIAAETAAAAANDSETGSELPRLDEVVEGSVITDADVDKLPRASANKKRKSKLLDQTDDS